MAQLDIQKINPPMWVYAHIISALLIYFDPCGPHLLSSYYNSFVFLLCVVNNLYQIASHFYLGIGFTVGGSIKNQVIGADDKQTALTFILSTVIDYLGWVHLGYYAKVWNVFIRYLGYTHLSVGVISFLNHNSFQTTFINRHSHWTSYLKAGFVLTDSFVRSSLLSYVMYNIITGKISI